MTKVFLIGLVSALAVLAADVSGKWKAVFDTQIGQQSYVYEFKLDGTKLTGKATQERGSFEITEGKVTGDKIQFVENFVYEGMEIRIEYTGKFDGADKIQFTRNVGQFAVEEFPATRVKQ